MRILIKNGHVIDFKNEIDEKMDIIIEDNIISDIAPELEDEGCEIIDADGKYVFPGLIDAHAHLRDPGYEYKEDIESGTMSAAKGGFTSVACMPNTSPVIDNRSVISYILEKAKTDAYVNVYPIGAISKGLMGKELAEIGDMKFAGAVAISDDGKPVQSADLMKKAMQYSEAFDISIISHCENMDLAEDGVMNEGYTSTVMGLKGIPTASEAIMVSRDILLSEYTKVPVHIAHVSCRQSVDIIREAKKRGVKVTAETCPHYFSITEKACEGFDTYAKVNPPLRTDDDVSAIVEGLKDGTIDIIATDHAPHHEDEKNVEFQVAMNGMIGFETAFPLVITKLVKEGHLTLSDVVEKMCYNPSRLLSINRGSIEKGAFADIIIADINEEYTVDIDKFKSKSRNSPFGGMKLSGIIYYTIVNGQIVLKDKDDFRIKEN
jgi:dihydroorotase